MTSSRKTSSPTLRSLGENELVRRIARWSGGGASAFVVPSAARAVPRGSAGNPSTIPPARRPPWADSEVVVAIGDDTALVRTGGPRRGAAQKGSPQEGAARKGDKPTAAALAPLLALTTDLLVEGVHFLPDHPARLLGAKALEVNLSDLAATGAWPAWYLVSLGAPPDTPEAWVRNLYAGMRSVAGRYGCACIGGDCVRAESLTINIVAGGLCEPGVAPPLRSRATVGQSLYVTGTLGDSGAGFELLLAQAEGLCANARGSRTAEGVRSSRTPNLVVRASRLQPSQRLSASEAIAPRDLAYLLSRHQHPTARVEAGAAIARLCPDAAMMDLSDGLATDLPRLAEASGCRFDVRLDALPLSPALRRCAAQLGGATLKGGANVNRRGPEKSCDAAVAFALNGGEDYELLFTTARPESEWRDAVARAAGGRPLRVTRIGEVTAHRGGGMRYLDASGHEIASPGRSFEHY